MYMQSDVYSNEKLNIKGKITSIKQQKDLQPYIFFLFYQPTNPIILSETTLNSNNVNNNNIHLFALKISA